MNQDNTIKTIKWAIRGVGALVLLAVLFVFSPIGIVDPGHRGVMTTLGKVNDKVIGEGPYFKIPFIQRVRELPVRIVKIEAAAPAYTKDIQVVDTVIALNYHLLPEQVNLLYKDIGLNWETVVIQPAIQESVKAVIAKYNSQELLDQRPKVKDEIKAELVSRLTSRFMFVDEFSVNELSFSDEYEKSIERKQVAKQDALAAEAKLSQVEFEAKQKVESATAEATAIRIQAQAITQQGGKEYVALQWIEAWKSGGAKVPEFITGDQGANFLLDINR